MVVQLLVFIGGAGQGYQNHQQQRLTWQQQQYGRCGQGKGRAGVKCRCQRGSEGLSRRAARGVWTLGLVVLLALSTGNSTSGSYDDGATGNSSISGFISSKGVIPAAVAPTALALVAVAVACC
jgi:hypothetical protein